MDLGTRRQTAPQPSAPAEDNQKLSDLIGDIYDAALDQSLWPGVIARAADFVGGVGAALFSKDAAGQLGDVHYDVGTDPYYKQLYFEKYIALDPATTGQFFAEIGEPCATADLMPYAEFTETRFYREWVRPQGLVDFATAVLDKSATSVAMFGVFRHERNGIVDDEARRRMRLIVPHIRRAVLIGRMFDLKAAEVETFAETLDGLSAGMCLIDAEGRIVHANAAGHAIIAAGDVLRVVGGRLVACDARIDQTLREVFAAAGQGDAALGTKGIAVPLAGKDGERYVAHVLPLTSGARRRAGIAYTAAAALFVRKAALSTPSPPEVIGKAFKLTPTELRVLLAIVEVGGVAKVAAALGVSDSTVKTHLGRLFEKTGATRQADLVKLVAAYATPLTA
ncbi:helix-turn-helix transcriptional regulator [Bradyrhizobium sp.]|uniref:helix-turn-helix transcriptional regulator n=1 Tax=Bradyrhizobium sp. TaxID=376 RepID=UPI003C76FD76